MTFQQVMDYHPDNRRVYKEIKDNLNQLIPFVGAGLTAPFFGGWTTALEALSQRLASAEKRSALKALLDENKHLEAAELLAQERGGNNLSHDVGDYFSMEKVDKRLEQNPGALNKLALYLLPPLFPCPVLTTNFDRLIERVYRQTWDIPDFESLSPASKHLRNRAIRFRNAPCLFHLHGAVTDGMVEEETLVLTAAQYDRHYGPESETIKALETFVKGRSLLFLGCSLDRDRTMDVLRKTAEPGYDHYAIVSCPPGSQDMRVRQLSELCIRAIVYPDREYDAVRIVMEQLLHDTNHTEYQKLKQRISLLPQISEGPFVYRAKMTELVGRKRELEDLRDFVTGDAGFLWWAITGAGGSGKSRLATEFGVQLADSTDWQVRILDKEDYKSLSVLAADRERKTLLIADNVQANVRTLGRFIESESGRPHTRPLRVLLVERTGESIRSRFSAIDWLSQLFEEVAHPARVSNCCYNEGTFLTLSPLSDAALTDIVSSFARHYRDAGLSSHSLPSEHDCANLLEGLYDVDSELRRPLYILFLTAAWMDGGNPTHWSEKEILEDVIERECITLDYRIREATYCGHRNNRLWRSCIYIHLVSTAMQGILVKQAETLCKKQWECLTNAAIQAGLEDPATLLSRIGLLRENLLQPMKPDIIGEYFVYQWLINADDEEKDSFLKSVWSEPINTGIFFRHILTDYSHLLYVNPEHYSKIIPPDLLITDHASDNLTEFGRLYVNGGYWQMFRLLGLRQRSIWNPDLARELAYVLYKLSNHLDIVGREEMTSRLEMVQRDFPDDQYIAELLAAGLYNLAHEQEGSSAKGTLSKLEQLQKAFPDNYEIAYELAKGLVNLMVSQQSESETTALLLQLQGICEAFNNEEKMSVQLAMGIYNLACKQDYIIASQTLSMLHALQMVFPWNGEIQDCVNLGFMLLVWKQSN